MYGLCDVIYTVSPGCHRVNNKSVKIDEDN